MTFEIIEGEPAKDYHAKARKYLSSHQLIRFAKCPKKYKLVKDGLLSEPDTDYYRIGRAIHSLTLEGREQYESEFLRSDGPINEKTGKPYGEKTQAFSAWRQQQVKEVITSQEAVVIENCAYSVSNHTEANDLLSGGTPELVIRGNHVGHPCQVRLDYKQDRLIVDLKTCRNLDQFEESVERYSYLLQFGFYSTVAKAAFEDFGLGFSVVAVEKQEPYRTGVWHLQKQTIADARWNVWCKMVELSACIENDYWPTRYESPRWI